MLVAHPGAGPELVGPGLALRPEQGEDSVAYTLRWLGRIVADACAVTARLRVPLPGAGSPIGGGSFPGR